MLRALQADINAWPQRVKAAGVTNAGGAAYVPQARNLEILRTPDDPEATYAYMQRAWQAPDARDALGDGRVEITGVAFRQVDAGGTARADPDGSRIFF